MIEVIVKNKKGEVVSSYNLFDKKSPIENVYQVGDFGGEIMMSYDLGKEEGIPLVKLLKKLERKILK